MHYHLIGQIAGNKNLFYKVLENLGYEKKNRWKSPYEDTKIIFLGDLIGNSSENLKIIREMKNIEEDLGAISLMGDFEYKLLGHLKTTNPNHHDTLMQDEYLHAYHQFTGDNLLTKQDIEETTDWLRSRPLFYANSIFSAIHACWHDEAIEIIKEFTDLNFTIKKGFMDMFYDPFSPAYFSIQKILSGTKIKSEKRKTEYCQKWWIANPQKLRDAIVLQQDQITPDDSSTEIPSVTQSENMIFFSHYESESQRPHQSHKKLCLGKLNTEIPSVMAYCYRKSETEINTDNIRIFQD